MSDDPEKPEITLYTIGHSNIQAGKLIELLEKHEIQAVVDVRSTPYSRYSPQFNREEIKQTLQNAGIDYHYLGDYLGGRPKDPSCYKNNEIPEGKADYRQLLDYPTVMTKGFFKEGIKRLLDIAQEKRTAILCSEADPAKCHRHHLIGRYLVSMGVEVLHIGSDGNCQTDQQLENPPGKSGYVQGILM